MATEQILHMIGGVGQTSYANNSFIQREGLVKEKPMLEEAIRRLYGTNFPSCFKVADLGCSSGPNALLVASNIISIVDSLSHCLNQEPPAFQFFLNDLFGNDFNAIFKSLPNFYKRLEQEKGQKFGPCFFNATLGTFYGRIYPSNSIDFFHSSYGQHFLSQAPKGLSRGEEPLNKGNTYFTSTTPPAVYKAYLEQFQEDFMLFLKSRSEELVPGGGMVLTFFGRDEADDMITPWGLIGVTLNEMVLENIVEEAKLDSFNLPIYAPTAAEVEHKIQVEGSFTLQRLEMIKYGWEAGLTEGGDSDSLVDENIKGDYVAKYVRAITEPVLKAHFGEGIMDELFLRFKKKVATLLREQQLEHAILAMFMTKNA